MLSLTLDVTRVQMSKPDEFFKHIRKHDADKLCVWNGELFFELHNGTYTSQAKVRTAPIEDSTHIVTHS